MKINLPVIGRNVDVACDANLRLTIDADQRDDLCESALHRRLQL